MFELNSSKKALMQVEDCCAKQNKEFGHDTAQVPMRVNNHCKTMVHETVLPSGCVACPRNVKTNA